MKQHPSKKPITEISKKSIFSPYVKNEYVQPIKKRSDRAKFKKYWLGSHYHGMMGRRNWALFRTGIVTALRASDLVKLQMWQVFDKDNSPRNRVLYERDQKTGKNNRYLDIKSLKDDLYLYLIWRQKHGIRSEWLFPQYRDRNKHITAKYLYLLMSKTADRLGIEHIGSHSLRKTFGYLAMKQTGNIVYVMKRLNQSSPKTTLRYIGLDRQNMDSITDKLDLH